MKKFSVLLTTIFMSLSLLAQAPMGINYQTVIRDGAGNILPDAEISLQMTIRSGAPDGEVVYAETHDVTTNAFGLVNLVIGQGVPQTGNFASIAWADGEKYLETAIDIDSGGYAVLGVTQFLSVPYAIFSQKAAAVKDGANPGEMLYWDGEEWLSVVPGEHNQLLRFCNGRPNWGDCPDLPTVTSAPLTAITSSSAIGGGNVTANGGSAVLARGIVWSTSPVPTIDNYLGMTTDGEGLGTFTSSLTGLTPETKYYVRAYATNFAGTAYGDELSFITSVTVFTTIETFTISGKASGLAWDGQFLYFGIYGTNGDKVYRFNPSTGEETLLFSNPEIGNSYGMTYDGEYLWIIDQPSGFSNPALATKLDFSGNILQTVQLAQRYMSGIAFDNGGFWVGTYHPNPGLVEKIDNTGSVLKSFIPPDDQPWDITLQDEFLWIVDYFAHSICRVDTISGQILEYHPSEDQRPAGVVYDGQFLWYIDGPLGSSSTLYKVNINEASQTYSLNLVSEPSEAGTVSGTGQYGVGEQINISATANNGWQFVNWTDDDGIVSETPNFTYTMPAEDVTLTANFEADTPSWQHCPGMPTVTDIDGNIYNTVHIGNQCWMKENLKTTKYRNGTPIIYPGGNNTAWANDTTGAYAWYNNDIGWKDIYGALYNWHAVNNINGLCPSGWHVPSVAEWEDLISYLASQGFLNGSAIVIGAGNALKSCRQVDSPLGGACNTNEHPRWYAHHTHYGFDEFGFSGLPGSSRSYLGCFGSIGGGAKWWSSMEWYADNAWSRKLSNFYGYLYSDPSHKANGLSVRCLRDETAPPPTYNLNLEVSPADAGTVTGAGQYEAGEQVIITAAANHGWEFENWTDNGGIVSEAANFTYTMPAEDVTLTANFEEDTPTWQPCPGMPTFTDSRDGQTYTTVQIGNQCWMKENLKYLPSVVGAGTGSNTVPHYYVYHYDGTDVNAAKATLNYQTYGALYNWTASLTACPVGWHLPTDAEWTALTTYVSSIPEYLCNSNSDWIAKSLAATTNWITNTGTCAVGNNLSANNETGFTGLPGGTRNTLGAFNSIGGRGFFWSSTEYSTARAWARFLYYDGANVGRNNYVKDSGFSVRCVRDETAPPPTYNLNLEVSPAGAGTVTGAGQYDAGEEVTITAEANPGWEFVNWTDDDGIVSEAASFVYTMPAEDITLTANFSSQSLNIGDFYQGGIIAYILQPGDPGYIEGEVHGLIAAPTDQSTGVQWGCFGTLIGGTSTALGTGAANTAAIVAGCTTAGIPARICDDLELNGYSDWYLPSKDELNKLYINRAAIGGFGSVYYWSSSEYSSTNAWRQDFFNGFQDYYSFKNYSYGVRAVRAF